MKVGCSDSSTLRRRRGLCVGGAGARRDNEESCATHDFIYIALSSTARPRAAAAVEEWRRQGDPN